MERMKPNKEESNLYLQNNKRDGESIRAAALMGMSDSDDDNPQSEKIPRSSEMVEITNINDFFNDREMSLEEEEIYKRNYAESLKNYLPQPSQVFSTYNQHFSFEFKIPHF